MSSSPGSGPLPTLGVADFSPGRDHLALTYQNGKVFAALHENDPAHHHLPNLAFAPGDSRTSVFVHGGEEATRFEKQRVGTHEIPADVVARLLIQAYGVSLDGRQVRMCTCYGNLLRPGDARTAVGRLAALLPRTSFEGYHGLVHIDLTASPPTVTLGDSLAWDPATGPYLVGPPGPWESVPP